SDRISVVIAHASRSLLECGRFTTRIDELLTRGWGIRSCVTLYLTPKRTLWCRARTTAGKLRGIELGDEPPGNRKSSGQEWHWPRSACDRYWFTDTTF